MQLVRRVTVATVWLAVIAFANAVLPSDGELFDIFEINTGSAQHQIVLSGAFTDSGHTELAVINSEGNASRSVTVYRLEGDQWQSVREWPLEREIKFFDRVSVRGRDHLLTYRPRGFGRFDVDTGIEERLVDVSVDFKQGSEGGIPRLEVVRDLNDDGRGDLVMPDTDGFWISTQRTDGSFTEARKVGPSEPLLDAKAYGDKLSYGEVGINAQTLPWYLSRVHQLDHDLDGSLDLAFWNDTGFEVYRQDDSGRFVDKPESFPSDVPFDFDGSYALAFQFSDKSVATLLLGLGGRFEYTILQGFPDLNRDGVADLVTLTFSGRRVFSLRGRYDVHFGNSTSSGVAFSSEPDTSAWTPGPAGGSAWGYASQRYVDIDGDGMKDLIMASVNTGLGGMTRAMVGNSISMEVAAYQLENGAYRQRPAIKRKIRTPFAPFDERGVLFPTVLAGDVNGDERVDLLAVERWDELSVYLGENSPELLSKDRIGVAVEAPTDERFVKVRDLDGDRKDDVVIHHPSATESNRVVVLLAR